MPKSKTGADEKHRHDPPQPRIDRTDERSSPGSGEDKDEAADLQPDELEDGDTAR